MKYRIRKTNEIVDVVDYSACTHTRFHVTDYVCYIDSKGKEIIGGGLNLIWDFEPINEESANNFDWQSFRAEAAKDILCAIITANNWFYGNETESATKIESAIKLADKLISKLKEKEEN